jgi:transposase
MQFQTTLTARVPRCSCDRCGVKTVSVPRAEKHSRFTLLFEAFAIDGNSFAAGQDDVSMMTDIDQSRVLKVPPDRFHIAMYLNEAVDKVRRTAETHTGDRPGMESESCSASSGRRPTRLVVEHSLNHGTRGRFAAGSTGFSNHGL